MSKNGRALNRENRKLIERRLHRCTISPPLSSLVRFYASNSQNVASYPLRPLPVFALSPLSQSFPSPQGPCQCSTLAKRTKHYLFNFLSQDNSVRVWDASMGAELKTLVILVRRLVSPNRDAGLTDPNTSQACGHGTVMKEEASTRVAVQATIRPWRVILTEYARKLYMAHDKCKGTSVRSSRRMSREMHGGKSKGCSEFEFTRTRPFRSSVQPYLRITVL